MVPEGGGMRETERFYTREYPGGCGVEVDMAPPQGALSLVVAVKRSIKHFGVHVIRPPGALKSQPCPFAFPPPPPTAIHRPPHRGRTQHPAPHGPARPPRPAPRHESSTLVLVWGISSHIPRIPSSTPGKQVGRYRAAKASRHAEEQNEGNKYGGQGERGEQRNDKDVLSMSP